VVKVQVSASAPASPCRAASDNEERDVDFDDLRDVIVDLEIDEDDLKQNPLMNAPFSTIQQNRSLHIL
jgi:hypothetical protein